MFKYCKSLIKRGTGDSSKAFFLVVVTIMGCMVMTILSSIILYDGFSDGVIDTNLTGLAEVIAAVTAMLGSAGACKAFADSRDGERKNYDDSEL